MNLRRLDERNMRQLAEVAIGAVLILRLVIMKIHSDHKGRIKQDQKQDEPPVWLHTEG